MVELLPWTTTVKGNVFGLPGRGVYGAWVSRIDTPTPLGVIYSGMYAAQQNFFSLLLYRTSSAPFITHSLHYLCNHAVHKAPILITMGLDYIATGKTSAAVVFLCSKKGAYWQFTHLLCTSVPLCENVGNIVLSTNKTKYDGSDWNELDPNTQNAGKKLFMPRPPQLSA